ncbi:MAG: hypothetical protein WC440_03790 [Candidatus Omnitrophota bacterium]
MKPNQYQPTVAEKFKQMEKADATISIESLAVEFGVRAATISRWIKNGIPGKANRKYFDELYREKIGKQ